MFKIFVSVFFAFGLSGVISSAQAIAAVCGSQLKASALNMVRTYSPSGFRVFNADQKIGAQLFWADAWWTDCESSPLDSAIVAIHESVHGLSAQSYFILDGSQIPQTSDTNLFAPALIANRISNSDRFKDIYLKKIPGAMSSATNFSILLDEMNAYTLGLQSATDLRSAGVSNQWRSGALAMMTFVSHYVSMARGRPAAYQALRSGVTFQSLKILYEQAHQVVLNSCQGSASLTTEDVDYLEALCKTPLSDELSQLIGGNVGCPTSCRPLPVDP